MSNSYYSHSSGNPVALSRGVSASLRSEFDLVQAGFDAVQMAITSAQNYASAPAFDPTVTYTSGAVVFSNVDKQLYRRNSSGISATDPSADTTNWTRVVIGLIRVEVSGTTQAAVAGNDYWLENVALCAVTAPAAVDGARFAVTPANGLKTNTVDFGAATVRGPAGIATGVVTLDLGARMECFYSAAIAKWVLL